MNSKISSDNPSSSHHSIWNSSSVNSITIIAVAALLVVGSHFLIIQGFSHLLSLKSIIGFSLVGVGILAGPAVKATQIALKHLHHKSQKTEEPSHPQAKAPGSLKRKEAPMDPNGEMESPKTIKRRPPVSAAHFKKEADKIESPIVSAVRNFKAQAGLLIAEKQSPRRIFEQRFTEDEISEITEALSAVQLLKLDSEETGIIRYSNPSKKIGEYHVFELKKFPGVIFKTPKEGDPQAIVEKYVAFRKEARDYCANEALYLLDIPLCGVLAGTTIIWEEKLSLLPDSKSVFDYAIHDEEAQPLIKEYMRQLAIFICKFGFSDVKMSDNLNSNNLPFTVGGRFGLIDIDKKSATTGLTTGGAQAKNGGLFHYLLPEMFEEFLTLIKEKKLLSDDKYLIFENVIYNRLRGPELRKFIQSNLTEKEFKDLLDILLILRSDRLKFKENVQGIFNQKQKELSLIIDCKNKKKQLRDLKDFAGKYLKSQSANLRQVWSLKDQEQQLQIVKNLLDERIKSQLDRLNEIWAIDDKSEQLVAIQAILNEDSTSYFPTIQENIFNETPRGELLEIMGTIMTTDRYSRFQKKLVEIDDTRTGMKETREVEEKIRSAYIAFLKEKNIQQASDRITWEWNPEKTFISPTTQTQPLFQSLIQIIPSKNSSPKEQEVTSLSIENPTESQENKTASISSSADETRTVQAKDAESEEDTFLSFVVHDDAADTNSAEDIGTKIYKDVESDEGAVEAAAEEDFGTMQYKDTESSENENDTFQTDSSHSTLDSQSSKMSSSHKSLSLPIQKEFSESSESNQTIDKNALLLETVIDQKPFKLRYRSKIPPHPSHSLTSMNFSEIRELVENPKKGLKKPSIERKPAPDQTRILDTKMIALANMVLDVLNQKLEVKKNSDLTSGRTIELPFGTQSRLFSKGKIRMMFTYKDFSTALRLVLQELVAKGVIFSATQSPGEEVYIIKC